MRISDWSSDVCSSDLSSSSGSPSGSTHPGRTGTVTVPPRATSGVGHGTRHPSTPHHCGAPSPDDTVRVMPAGSERSPSVAVPSVTAYWKVRSEEHTSELQSLMRLSYAVFCLKKKYKLQPQIDITYSVV